MPPPFYGFPQASSLKGRVSVRREHPVDRAPTVIVCSRPWSTFLTRHCWPRSAVVTAMPWRCCTDGTFRSCICVYPAGAPTQVWSKRPFRIRLSRSGETLAGSVAQAGEDPDGVYPAPSLRCRTVTAARPPLAGAADDLLVQWPPAPPLGAESSSSVRPHSGGDRAGRDSASPRHSAATSSGSLPPVRVRDRQGPADAGEGVGWW